MFTQRKLLVLVMISLVLFSGCSKPADDEAEDIKERTAIRLMGVDPLTEKDFFKGLLEYFKDKHPEINLKYDYVTRNYFEKVLTQIAGGAAPDVLWMNDISLLTFAGKGVLLSLDSFIKENNINLDEYFSQAWKAYSYKGKIYCVSESFSPYVLYYNKEIFDEAGISYPDETWGWERFLQASKNLTKRDERGITLRFGASGERQSVLMMLMRQAGGKILNADKTRCIMNSPENIEALRFYYDLSVKYHVVPVTMGSDPFSTEDYIPFMMEKAAMFYGGRWHSRYFRTKEDLKFGIAVLPRGKERATLLVSHAFAITSACKYPKEAWKLVKFIMGEESQDIIHFGKIPDSVPTLKILVNSEQFLYDPRFPEERDNKIYIDSLEHAFSQESSPYITYSYMDDIINHEIDLALLEKQSVEDALKKAEDRINAVIQEQLENYGN